MGGGGEEGVYVAGEGEGREACVCIPVLLSVSRVYQWDDVLCCGMMWCVVSCYVHCRSVVDVMYNLCCLADCIVYLAECTCRISCN